MECAVLSTRTSMKVQPGCVTLRDIRTPRTRQPRFHERHLAAAKEPALAADARMIHSLSMPRSSEAERATGSPENAENRRTMSAVSVRVERLRNGMSCVCLPALF